MVIDDGYRLHAVKIYNMNEPNAVQEAKKIIKKIKFYRPLKKNGFSFRVIPKTKFIPRFYRTKKINENINLIYGKLKKEFYNDYPKLQGDGIIDSISTLIRGEKDFNNISKRTISQYGDNPIFKLTIYKTPVTKIAQSLLNVITLGKLEEAKKKLNYDDVFHIGLIADIGNKNIVVEKNEVINISTSYPTNENTEKMDVPMKGKEGKITINNLLLGARQKMGESNFFDYDGFNNNCQVFIKNILEAQNLYNEQINKFLFQDALKILENLPGYTQPVAKLITRLGAFWNRLIGKSKNIAIKTKKDKKELQNIINEYIGTGGANYTYGEVAKTIKLLKKEIENIINDSSIDDIINGKLKFGKFDDKEIDKTEALIQDAIDSATNTKTINKKVKEKIIDAGYDEKGNIPKNEKIKIINEVKNEIKNEVKKETKTELKEIIKEKGKTKNLNNFIDDLVDQKLDSIEKISISNKIQNLMDDMKNFLKKQDETNLKKHFINKFELLKNSIDTFLKINQNIDNNILKEGKNIINLIDDEIKSRKNVFNYQLIKKIEKLKDNIDKSETQDNLNELKLEGDKLLFNIEEFLKVKDKGIIKELAEDKLTKFNRLSNNRKLDYMRLYGEKYAKEIVTIPQELETSDFHLSRVNPIRKLDEDGVMRTYPPRDPYRQDESMNGLIDKAIRIAKDPSFPKFNRRYQRLKILNMVDYIPEIKRRFQNDERIAKLRNLRLEPKIKKPKKEKKKKEKVIEQIPPDPRFQVDNRKDIIKVINLLINEPDFKRWAIDGELSLNDISNEKQDAFEEAEGYLNDIWGSEINKKGNEWTIIDFVEKLQSEGMTLQEILKNLNSKINIITNE